MKSTQGTLELARVFSRSRVLRRGARLLAACVLCLVTVMTLVNAGTLTGAQSLDKDQYGFESSVSNLAVTPQSYASAAQVEENLRTLGVQDSMWNLFTLLPLSVTDSSTRSEMLYWEYSITPWFEKTFSLLSGQWPIETGSVALTGSAARELGLGPGDTLTAFQGKKNLKIVGVITPVFSEDTPLIFGGPGTYATFADMPAAQTGATAGFNWNGGQRDAVIEALVGWQSALLPQIPLTELQMLIGGSARHAADFANPDPWSKSSIVFAVILPSVLLAAAVSLLTGWAYYRSLVRAARVLWQNGLSARSVKLGAALALYRPVFFALAGIPAGYAMGRVLALWAVPAWFHHPVGLTGFPWAPTLAVTVIVLCCLALSGLLLPGRAGSGLSRRSIADEFLFQSHGAAGLKWHHFVALVSSRLTCRLAAGVCLVVGVYLSYNAAAPTDLYLPALFFTVLLACLLPDLSAVVTVGQRRDYSFELSRLLLKPDRGRKFTRVGRAWFQAWGPGLVLIILLCFPTTFATTEATLVSEQNRTNNAAVLPDQVMISYRDGVDAQVLDQVSEGIPARQRLSLAQLPDLHVTGVGGNILLVPNVRAAEAVAGVKISAEQESLLGSGAVLVNETMRYRKAAPQLESATPTGADSTYGVSFGKIEAARGSSFAAIALDSSPVAAGQARDKIVLGYGLDRGQINTVLAAALAVGLVRGADITVYRQPDNFATPAAIALALAASSLIIVAVLFLAIKLQTAPIHSTLQTARSLGLPRRWIRTFLAVLLGVPLLLVVPGGIFLGILPVGIYLYAKDVPAATLEIPTEFIAAIVLSGILSLGLVVCTKANRTNGKQETRQ